MSVINIIFLCIGIFNFFIGIIWSKKDWLNVFVKILFMFSGVFCVYYSLLLNNIILY